MFFISKPEEGRFYWGMLTSHVTSRLLLRSEMYDRQIKAIMLLIIETLAIFYFF